MIIRGLNILKRNFGSDYSKAMYEAWRKNPSDVHEDWNIVFNSSPKDGESMSSPQLDKERSLALSAYMLIRYFKTRGHELAELDPLKLVDYKQFGKVFVKNSLQNDLEKLKITEEKDLDEPFTFPNNSVFQQKIARFIGQKNRWTIREIHERLQKIYSQKIGLEFMHISDSVERQWIMKQFQQLSFDKIQKLEKVKILEDLTKSETFNVFLNDKLKTSKRFGVEGLDSMISGLNKLIVESVSYGVQYIGLGMAHRGRLSTLTNVFDKKLEKIFAEFQQNVDKQVWGNSGDVKYHLGATTDIQVNGKHVKLSIMPNPSHLQTVNPVVMGHVKAVKDSLKNQQKSLAVIIHGDAAVAGQGIVFQCLQLAYPEHYSINGVIHIVANNQIGFTTTPAQARTGLYCTSVAKAIQAPVIHVNADEPELVNKALKLAVKYRQTFKKDIFVDIVGYRRYGHNEQDQPAFTQPMMYQNIGQRPTIYKIYAEQLVKEGSLSEAEVKDIWNKHFGRVSEAYAQSLKSSFNIKNWRNPTFHSVVDYNKLGRLSQTGIQNAQLHEIGAKLTQFPEGFTLHPTLKKIYDQRKVALDSGSGLDFAMAESLAFGSLLKEGFNIRLSGQDVERGTFSHRHAVLTNPNTEQKFMPLHNFLTPEEKWRCQIGNSPLTEYAAMGFQYGYSFTNPNTLSIWQAQFGDFANGAQIVIDNYLTSGQSKWTVQNSLVVNLPHGNDGQGPQHSSGRIERFLQMMNDSWVDLYNNGELVYDEKALRHANMAIICCSTAHGIFHAYRRQLRRDFRKPLINFMNKKLLKAKDACSSFSELNRESFDTIIDDTSVGVDPKSINKLVLCMGQAYYAAAEKRTELQRKDVALVRIEQLAPLHYSNLVKIFEKYSNASEIIWFQEEHKNAGPWQYLNPRISVVLEVLKKKNKIKTGVLDCISRRTAASPAVGSKSKHDYEQVEVLRRLYEK